MKFIKLVLTAAFFQLLTACVPPQDDESEKIGKMMQQAERGDAHAQLLLGWAYRDGEGVPQDYAQSVKWLRKAAEQGDAFAQDSLSDAYLEGRGVPQDDAQSVYWLRKAAEQGNTFSQGALSNRYQEGKGVPQDEAQAVYWLRKIAEQGGAGAQHALSDRYRQGKGVPQDLVLAYAWLNLAVTSYQGEVVSARDWVEKTPDGIENMREREGRSRLQESAESALERATVARDAAAEKLSPTQLAEAQRLSSSWQKGRSIQREKL